MTTELRDLMHRVADTAPVADVEPGTWRRARRARRRELLAVPALVAALVLGVVVAGGDTAGMLHEQVAPAGEGRPGPDRPLRSGAVPAVIHAIPDAMDSTRPDGSWSTPRVPVADLVRASAAYVTIGGGVVMVDARTGEHQVVDLPGFNDRLAGMEESPMVALSSDGLRVAYSWRDPVRPPDGERWETGIAVIQLGGDRPEVHRLPDGVGVRVVDIAWSPNGRFVVYRVMVLTRMGEDSYSSSGNGRIERLDIFSGERVAVPRLGGFFGPAAVSDGGVVALPTGSAVYTWPATGVPAAGGGVGKWQVGQGRISGHAAWSEDRRRIAVGNDHEDLADVAVAEPARKRLTRLGATEPGAVRVLGWVGRHHVAAYRHDAGQWSEVQLVLLDVRSGAARVVGVIETAITLQLGQLTVATGLMTPSRPTVEFEPPAWTRPGPWWWVGGAAGLLVVAGAGAWFAVRRRERLRRGRPRPRRPAARQRGPRPDR